MPTISLGNIGNIGGKTVIGGGQSGLDTETLIKSLTEAKRLPAVRLESTVEANTEKSDALTELQDILGAFKDAANFLRNPAGVGNITDNVFAYRSGAVTSNTSVAGSTYLGATVAAGTDPQTYSLTVDQLATKQVRITNTFALADLNT